MAEIPGAGILGSEILLEMLTSEREAVAVSQQDLLEARLDLHEAEVQHNLRAHDLRQRLGELGVVGRGIRFSGGTATGVAFRELLGDRIHGWIDSDKPLAGLTGQVIDCDVIEDAPIFEVSMRRGEKLRHRLQDTVFGRRIYRVNAAESTFMLTGN